MSDSSLVADNYAGIAQLCGLALGLSVAGAIFLNLAEDRLAVLLPAIPRAELQQFVSGTSSSLFDTLAPDIRAQALDILVEALRTT